MINFAVSLATSLLTGKPQGIKVPDRILTEAARRAKLKEQMNMRIRSDEEADLAEAVIAAAWLTGRITIEDLVCRLARGIDEMYFTISNRGAELLTDNLAQILIAATREVDLRECLENFELHLRRRLGLR